MENKAETSPLISVIVPVYNVEEYLERCFLSIKKQVYSNLEIILVDDGSPDNSPYICERLKDADERVVVVHKQNGGLSSARNAGLEIANGEYIMFVDSDDWLEPDAISYLFDFLKRESADFVMGSFVRSSIDNYAYDVRENTYDSNEFIRKIFKYHSQETVQYAWGKLYKSSLFESTRYPVGLTSEDIPVAFEVSLRANKIGMSTKVIYHYFVNPCGITGVRFDKRTFDMLAIWKIVVCISNTQNDELIKSLALINLKRADLGIMYDFASSPNLKKNYEDFGAELIETQHRLRNNCCFLLRTHLPVSRKVLIILFSIIPKTTVRIINSITAFHRIISTRK